MSDDLSLLFAEWPYDPDEDVPVRLIPGDDGRMKVQMRIDLGIMQMELDGHPTGETPEGFESWFDLYEHRRAATEAPSPDDHVALSEQDVRILRREAIQYYYRYLSLMKLGDYPRVVRDTERNLRLFEFVRSAAARDIDRWSLDQYRPYVIMVNTQAKVALAIQTGGFERGQIVEICDAGIGGILAFYNDHNLATELEHSIEISLLTALKTQFLKDGEESLEDRLDLAVREERFEDAAALRDELHRRHKA